MILILLSLKNYLIRGRTAVTLGALTDRELQDIGLTRADIVRVSYSINHP